MILKPRAPRAPPGGLAGPEQTPPGVWQDLSRLRWAPFGAPRGVWGAGSPPKSRGGLGGIVPPRQQRRGRDTRTAAATNRPLRRPVRRAGSWHGGFGNQVAVRRR